jgi:hypothetical protein
MDFGDSWNTVREIWEHPAGWSSHSYDSDFTPPLSPLDPPKQGTRNETESDEDSRGPCTPSSHTFGSSRTQTYKGVQRTVRISGTDPFTPLNSPWPSPLFSERTTPRTNTLQRSKSRIIDHTATRSINCFERNPVDIYQEMGQQTSKRLSLSESRPEPALAGKEITEDSGSGSGSDSLPRPRRARRRPVKNSPKAPSPIGPFIKPIRLHPRKPLSPTVLQDHRNTNLSLLRCVCLLENDMPDCLRFANDALAIAEEAGLHDLATKCQMYRGHCLFALERWNEASDAFTRAATIRDFRNEVWVRTTFTKEVACVEARARAKGKKLTFTNDEVWNDRWR